MFFFVKIRFYLFFFFIEEEEKNKIKGFFLFVLCERLNLYLKFFCNFLLIKKKCVKLLKKEKKICCRSLEEEEEEEESFWGFVEEKLRNINCLNLVGFCEEKFDFCLILIFVFLCNCCIMFFRVCFNFWFKKKVIFLGKEGESWRIWGYFVVGILENIERFSFWWICSLVKGLKI